jgi:hypothetical protein
VSIEADITEGKEKTAKGNGKCGDERRISADAILSDRIT